MLTDVKHYPFLLSNADIKIIYEAGRNKRMVLTKEQVEEIQKAPSAPGGYGAAWKLVEAQKDVSRLVASHETLRHALDEAVRGLEQVIILDRFGCPDAGNSDIDLLAEETISKIRALVGDK